MTCEQRPSGDNGHLRAAEQGEKHSKRQHDIDEVHRQTEGGGGLGAGMDGSQNINGVVGAGAVKGQVDKLGDQLHQLPALFGEHVDEGGHPEVGTGSDG